MPRTLFKTSSKAATSKDAASPAPVPDDFICFGVYTAAHAFNRVYKPLLDPLKLTYPQYLVMIALWAKDQQTVGSLCEALFLESNTLTPLLKRLETAGYVTRQRDPDDERQVRIGLTKTGAALRAKTRDFPACIAAATGLTLSEAQGLHAGLLAMRRGLQRSAGGEVK